jgi:serine/threonine kinase 32
VKFHPWFRGIDWAALYKKEVVPPFEPDVSQIGIVS